MDGILTISSRKLKNINWAYRKVMTCPCGKKHVYLLGRDTVTTMNVPKNCVSCGLLFPVVELVETSTFRRIMYHRRSVYD